MVYEGKTAEWFLNFCRFRGKRYIFGTGTQAVNTMFLLKLVGESVDGALVSNVNDRSFCGIPVYGTDELGDGSDLVVIMAVSTAISKEVLPILEENGVSDIYLCTDWEEANDQVKEHVFRDYLEENNFDYEEDVITIGKCKFINPLKYRRCYRQMLMGTAFSDILLPGIMRDDRYGTGEVYELMESIMSEVIDVIDIGANAGVFSSYMASLGKNVLAIDASRTIFPFLKENATLAKTVEVMELIVSDSDGKMNFYDIEDYPKYSSTKPIDFACVYEQQSMTLDTIVDEKGIHPGFIRLDIGDDAIRAIRGGRNTIKKYHPCLLLWDAEGLIVELEKIDVFAGYEKKLIGGYVFFTWKGIE